MNLGVRGQVVSEGELNDLFLSKNLHEILRFYESFHTRDDLISWMVNRRSSDLKSYVYEGKSELVVVIPTIDHKSELSNYCVQTVYDGMTTIIVESGKTKFFNYSKSVNYGLKLALSYDPKWIIVSNDDVIKKDPIEKLTRNLSYLDNSKLKTVFTNPRGTYHSVEHSLCKSNEIRSSFVPLFNPASKALISLERKFNVVWNHAPPNFPYNFLFKNFKKFILTASFSIFSSEYVRELRGELFDETYLNGVEDIDTSYGICKDHNSFSYIDFNIAERVGTSLGLSNFRKFRDIANLAYLNSKLESGQFLL